MSTIDEPTGEYEIQVASEAIKKLYGDEKTADVYFTFKSKERIPAHKNLLAAASDVFDAMFYGPVKEKGDVEIDDASAVGFMEFLRFFYFDKIKLTMANIADVMNLGHKYNVTECFNLCVRFLTENLTVDNVIEVHNLAETYEQDDLNAKCEEFIAFNTEEVLKSTHFLQCRQRTLNFILKSDDLSCSETFVFEALMSWLKRASKQTELTKEIVQTHLGDLFHEIRFRSMCFDQFVDLLPSYGKLFTKDELCEILQMIRNAEFQPEIFNTLPRTQTLPWNEKAVLICNRLINIVNEGYRLQKIETTTFSTNKALLLCYFYCAPISNITANINGVKAVRVDVTIFRVSKQNEYQNVIISRTVLHTMKAELTTVAHRNIIKVPKPIIIRPDFEYDIQFDINISGDNKIDWRLKSKVYLEGDITVTFYNEPLVGGDRMGLINQLGFNCIE